MRSDLAHVYNTPARRSRNAECFARRGRPVRDLEDLPRFEGMADARRRGWERKERTQHWAALKRWLRSRAGRPWNEVWSEICRVSDSRSGATRTLREDLDWIVEHKTRRDADGTLRSYRGYRVSGLYVDPEGILRYEAPVRYRYKAPENPHVIAVDDRREFRRIDGIWFEIRYEDLPVRERSVGSAAPPQVIPSAYDLIERREVTRAPAYRWRKAVERYACAKRTLSAKELRAHNLVNDPEAGQGRR